MTNPVYISSDAMNALKEISRRHAYIKEAKSLKTLSMTLIPR